ncbi:aminoglycoside phosphotransferase family protein [Streptomyces endophyticus]|uniref:Aminoglycoside phosphotransferase family protein n=1 Tax=Streptomyces endophyticus TaxID=714166 RepID=A0ABU6F938_9ACTN|nr:aminoglycoside phosphotransferase family protein [Streptomyces endophyticus]MEB8340535.1 aminoglycoside phosphotransferase family protein [Streptomyces endophyticus]
MGAVDAWCHVVERAEHDGVAVGGQHNINHVVRLTAEEAHALDRPKDERVVVRRRRAGVPPVVIRTWDDEPEILAALRGGGRPVPECLARFDDVAVHSYMEGTPLSRTSGDGEWSNERLIGAFAEALTDLARVPEQSLPARPGCWPKDGDSRGFLRTLLNRAEEQIRRVNWPAYGGLLASLGVPEDALRLYRSRAPKMTPRPFQLLHGDLHRGNVIVPPGGRLRLTLVDWELATYGDPLHDLAVHLVRMGYTPDQRGRAIDQWHKAMWNVRTEAVEGLDTDLGHYIDFERAQSVFPDVIRAAVSLDEQCGQSDLEAAATEVHRALEVASGPLRLRNVLTPSAIEPLLYRWRAARRGRDRGEAFSASIHWERDEGLDLPADFGPDQVEQALWAERVAPARHVFKGTAHLGTFVEVRGFGRVMVRRKVGTANPIEPRVLDEHKVLRAIEKSDARASAPRVLALGTSDLGDRFTIQSYAGHHRDRGGPQHPEHGLLPGEVIDLADQLCQLASTGIEVKLQDMDGLGFYPWLCRQLAFLVRELSPCAKQQAAFLGLPDERELEDRLLRHVVHGRRYGLLHGDLNPWNLVRREGRTGLTLIDWEMAMVGDPLYDLVRHIHLTPTTREVRGRMYARWSQGMPEEFTHGWAGDIPVYQGLEVVRSAYVDLERVVTRSGLDAPNVRRAVGSYTTTLRKALAWLEAAPQRPRPARVPARTLGT